MFYSNIKATPEQASKYLLEQVSDQVEKNVSGKILVPKSKEHSVETSSREKNNTLFLSQYWRQPIQAILPATTKETIETTFTPKACATCHPKKFSDWKKSLHAEAMSVGVMVQLEMLSPEVLAKHYLNDKGCTHCHAPTQVQQRSLMYSLKVHSLNSPQSHSLVNPLNSFVQTDEGNLRANSQSTISESDSEGSLHQQGVICIACHVRNEHWFGPNSVSNSNHQPVNHQLNNYALASELEVQRAFASAQFCSNCHQFKEDGSSLAGKLIQNTYKEWQSTTFAQQGITCQNCHMPSKRHLFKGIHDKAMVLSGLTITSEIISKKSQITAYLKIKNTGVGHHFPTYVTPRVIVRAYQVDTHNNIIDNTTVQYEIMRAVSLDLADEYFDSRLAAGESYHFDYQQPRVAQAKQLVMEVVVEPDYFYQQFFSELLIEKTEQSLKANIDNSIVKSLRLAKNKTEASPYLLFSQSYTLHALF